VEKSHGILEETGKSGKNGENNVKAVCYVALP
jgi:hypothetical protein